MSRLFALLIACVCVTNMFAQTTAIAIGQSVNRFVDSLTPAQRQQTVFAFSDSARTQWTNLPVGAMPRKGISLGELSNSQRQLFHRVLSASFSSQGYLKITSVMHMDNITNSLTDSGYNSHRMNDTLYQMFKSFKYSHRNYYIAVFGLPLKDSVWGYKIEGHHLSVNVTYKKGRLFFTPFFIGVFPSNVSLSEYAGWRVLGREQDLSLQLFALLTPQQRKKAVSVQEAPYDIFTNWESNKNTLNYWGLESSEFTAAQRKLASQILEEYVTNLLPAEAATAYKISNLNGEAPIYFGWIGSGTEEEPHYFVLNGPSFLLEFADVGNHVHSIWREKGLEFGASVLKK